MIEAPAPFPAEVAKIPRGAALRRGLRANPLLVVGAIASACIVVVALLAPLLAPFPGDAGTATHPFTVLHPPSAQHWFGTDNVGRDILSRVLYGARISPLIALIVLLIAGAIGIPLGLAAGHPDHRDHRDRHQLVALVREADPRPGRLGHRASLHRGMPGAGHPPAADHLAARPAQLHHTADRADVAGRRRGDPDRVRAVVSWPRPPGPHTRLGTDGVRRAGLLHHRLVGGDVPGYRDHADRVRLQPARRRPARPARPETDLPVMRLACR